MQTLIGLIRESWNNLEEQHHLEERFGLEPTRFIHEVEANFRHRSRRTGG
jgi:hypothetical protein